MTLQGWGQGEWGETQWGLGTFPIVSAPIITPLSPLKNGFDVPQSQPISIRFSDNSIVLLSTLIVTVGGINYILGGAPRNGGTFTVVANDYNGFDIELRLPDLMPIGSHQEVSVTVRDDDANESSVQYLFTVGIGPRLLDVKNPRPGILAAYFNRPMAIDGTFLFAPNWQVEPVGAAVPLEITEVMASSSKPDIAFLRYEGGGSEYILTALRVLGQDGDPLQPGYNSALFEIIYGEEVAPTIRLFDTVFGPIGTSQRLITRRTMDDHVINRSIAIGMDEQFRLRFAAMDQTIIRGGAPGGRRT